MKERISEFPVRPSVTRYEEGPVPESTGRGKSGRWFSRLIVTGFLAYWLYSSGILQRAPEWLAEGYDRLTAVWQPVALPPPRSSQPPASSRQIPERRAPIRAELPRAESASVQQINPLLLESTAGVESVSVSISRGFRPVGFKIGASSKPVPFTGRPGSLHRRLPRFFGPSQKYGSIDLANGRRHAFVLDTDPKGYQLYVDLNRNGDLTDDGPPLPNRGKVRFANRLKLPLDSVSGIAQLKGDMELWIYSNDQSWRQDSLLFYNRTQLAGELSVKGRRYNAYLADNLVIDGDYRNDGISIDINGDGKIDRRSERLSPGDQITLNGERLSFTVIR